MKGRLVTILCLICFVTRYSYAQNLVPNPSFEENYSCPNSSDQVDSCIGWHSVLNTPDYFSLCAPYPVSVPDNFVGYQFPFDGNSYVGLITYEWWHFYREILGTQLLDTLILGNSYHISLRVSRGNWTSQNYNCASSNKLGLRFTTFPYSESSPPPINNYAQLYVDSIIKDTLNWVAIDWDYVADSAYKYIYIGNFFDDDHTDTATINAPLGEFGTAYYFIDSVKVDCSDQRCITAISTAESVENFLNFIPETKQMTIDCKECPECIISIFNCSGQILQIIHTNHSVIDLSNLVSGVYLVLLETGKKSLTKKIPIY